MQLPSSDPQAPTELQLAQLAATRTVLRFTGAAICIATVGLALVAALTTDPVLTLVALVGVPAAVAPWIESRRRRADIVRVLLLWLGALAVLVPVVPGHALVAVGVPLAAIAIIAGLLPDDQRRVRVVWAAAAAVAAWQLWWLAKVGGLDGAWAVTLVMEIIGMVSGILVVRLLRGQLVTTHARYRELFNGVPVGLFRTAPDGTILAANRRLAHMLGFDHVVDLLRANAIEFYVDPADRRRSLDAAEAGEAGAILPLRRRDGVRILVRETARAVRGPAGRVVGYEGSLEDVTQRVEAERSARRAEQLFAVAFEAAPIGMAVVSVDGRSLRMNRAFGDLVGAAPDLTGMEWTRILLRDDRQAMEEVIRSLVPGEAVEREVRFRHGSGAVRWGRMSVSMFAAEGEDEPALVVQLADVTAQKEIQQHLEGVVRAKDDFVASVSHELRTPLTVVVGLTRELLDQSGDFAAEEARELLEMVAEQSADVAHIVEDLLVVARTDLGRLTIASVPVDLGAEVACALRECDHLRRERGAVVAVSPASVSALADPLRVRQIVRNLLTNAFRYGGRHVEVELANGDGRARLRVCDDGPGIPPGEWEAVFRPYHRAHASPTVAGSIGLGLAVSRRLAEAMSGSLTYHQQDGRSIFELTLPIG